MKIRRADHDDLHGCVDNVPRAWRSAGFERVGEIEHMHVEGLTFEIYSLKAGIVNLDAP